MHTPTNRGKRGPSRRILLRRLVLATVAGIVSGATRAFVTWVLER